MITVKIADLIDKQSLRELKVVDNSALNIIAFDFALIILTAMVAELFHHPVSYLIGVIIIGARQNGLTSVLYHDGAHRNILKNPQANDLFCKIVGYPFTPIIFAFDFYRKEHFKHHQFVNTEDDPTYAIATWVFKQSRFIRCLFFFTSALGVGCLYFMLNFFAYKFLQSKLKAALYFILFLGMLQGIHLSFVLDFELGKLLTLYWLVPLVTWNPLLTLVRSFGEHPPRECWPQGKNTPLIFGTIDILNSPLERCFLVTRNANFHLSHHLFPGVPFYNLPKLQKMLTSNECYRNYGTVFKNYSSFLIWFLFQYKGCPAESNREQPSSPSSEFINSKP